MGRKNRGRGRGEVELFEDGAGFVGIGDEVGEAEAAAAGAGEGVDVVDAAKKRGPVDAGDGAVEGAESVALCFGTTSGRASRDAVAWFGSWW